MTKKRKRWVSALLSLALPGLGHLYAGHALTAAILFVINFVSLPLFLALFKSGPGPIACYATVLALLAFYIAVIVDAILSAHRSDTNFELKRYNRWYVYVSIYLLLAGIDQAVAMYIKNNIVKAYKLPAASMEPTLKVGDHILVDRSAEARDPKRGNIIVFEYPVDPEKDFVKRVVGVAGDIVEIKDKELIVNGQKQTESYVVHSDDKVLTDETRDNFGPVTVPEGMYFTLGDNRDGSYDSRFWGFVSKDKIRGTVKSIYWSWDRKNATVRWDRIGKAVNEL